MDKEKEKAEAGFSRRNFITVAGMGGLAFLLDRGRAFASEACAAPPPVTSEEALQMLMEGNARFVSGVVTRPNLSKERIAETSKGQHPFATTISCSDSRVPVEEVFDRGIGDIFVIRVAGNVAAVDELGTAEYGAGHLCVPLLVVLGHTKCGAVTAVVNGDEVGGNIRGLVGPIVPAVNRSKAKGLTGDDLINDAIRENVMQTISDIFSLSDELHKMVAGKKVRVIGAVYNTADGIVQWLGEHPDQAKLLGAKKTEERKKKAPTEKKF